VELRSGEMLRIVGVEMRGVKQAIHFVPPQLLNSSSPPQLLLSSTPPLLNS
jgi:hypothetical protein